MVRKSKKTKTTKCEHAYFVWEEDSLQWTDDEKLTNPDWGENPITEGQCFRCGMKVYNRYIPDAIIDKNGKWLADPAMPPDIVEKGKVKNPNTTFDRFETPQGKGWTYIENIEPKEDDKFGISLTLTLNELNEIRDALEFWRKNRYSKAKLVDKLSYDLSEPEYFKRLKK